MIYASNAAELDINSDPGSQRAIMGHVELPVEILDLIILAVAGSTEPVALPVSHPVTKTLWSCLFISKATYVRSLEQLYRRCLYIDSAWRLRAVLRAYGSRVPIFGRSRDPCQFKCAASTGLYLAPFTTDTIDERPVVTGIEKLFKLVNQYLKRLIIDMPLRSYYPDEAGSPNLRSVLRNAFLQLIVVEEFVSIRDELYLSTTMPGNAITEPPVWSTWAHLSRLALYNLAIDTNLTETLQKMPNLKRLVLTRPDTESDLDEMSEHSNPQVELVVVNSWRDLSPLHQSSWELAKRATGAILPIGSSATFHRIPPDFDFRPHGGATMDIICINGQNPIRDPRGRLPQPRNRYPGNNWAAYDLGDSYNDIKECQQWVKQSALDGTLWDVPNAPNS